MFEAIRVLPVSPKARAISPERIVKRAVARHTKRLVRTPAGLRRRSRSIPITAPSTAATVSRRNISCRESIASGTHCPPERNFSYLQYKLRQFQEVACPGVYLTAFQVPQPVKAKLFDGKADQDGTVNHGSAKRSVALVATSCQVAHEAASEAVARTGGIMRLFERESRHAEDATLVHHHGAVLSAFHNQRLRPHLENMLGRAQQVVLARKLPRFRVVDHQDVNMLQGLAQFRVAPLDPVVHGIQRGNFRPLLDLMKHVALQIGSDVGEENVL